MNIKRLIASVLALSLLFLTLASCSGRKTEKLGTGYSKYAASRSTEGRDISYVEMCVQSYGKVIILLDATTAPITVGNFLKLVREGFYDGLTFHRVIKDFMIQGGDPNGDGTGGSSEYIRGEFVLNGHYNDISHIRGVISMARSETYNSASSQFFITNADAIRSLDGSYAAFGYVIMGMSVIDEITEDVFPKTAYAKYYGSQNVSEQQIWQYYGNGRIEKNKDKPIIKYIKVLENYTPEFDYE